MLNVFAEREMMLERQREGIAKAWESGAEASTAHSKVRVKRWAVVEIFLCPINR
jgi:hypothetical protein